jgi:hypothetical protein
MTAPDNAGARQGGRFEKGRSGNPAGMPKGTRHRATQLVEQLFEGEAEGLARKAIERALAGDTTALRLVLERIAPLRKGRVVEFPMPIVKTAADAVTALSAILQALGDGRLTPEETATIAGAIEITRRSVEVADLERRIEALEQAKADEEGEPS